jgi:transcription initiation factor TFIIB
MECKSEGMVTNAKQGVVVCTTCGLVISSRIIDESAEWRNFGESDDGKTDMNRVGGKNNPFISTGGLDTHISGSNCG